MLVMLTEPFIDQSSREDLLKIIQQQSKEIHFLKEQILAYQRRQFAAKSEKIDARQISLFDEAKLLQSAEKLLNQEAQITVASYTRPKKAGRKALPAELLRVPRIYDLTPEEKICACSSELTFIKEEKSEQLEMIPAKIYVIEHIRKKYACKECQACVRLAEQPKAPIPRSIAASGLLSHVLVSKFQDHLPLHRQESILRRVGVDIPRSTLSLWVIKCAELFKPLLEQMHHRILSYDIAYADETTLQVLKEPNKSVASKKYMWLFSGGPPESFVYYYQYHPARSYQVPADFLSGFSGFLHCDGYPAYDALATQQPDITLVGCLYHARRKFVEAAKIMPHQPGLATQVLEQIAHMAHLDANMKLLTLSEKHTARQDQIKPRFDALHDFLMAHQASIPPKSLLGQAVYYTLNQWPKILNALKDPRLELSNNRSERAIKPFVIGRKGWLFAQSVEGAHAATIIFSLIETCKHHQIEPYDYFRYLLNVLPTCKTSHDYQALLPYTIDKKLLAPTLQ